MFYRIFKRIIDIIVALVTLICFSPILIILFLISFLLQGWPVFYISKRLIGPENEINIYKFRTMVKDAKSIKYDLDNKYMREGYLDIPLTSEVFTPIGRFMEKTQFVELPQLIAVLFGKMSFVGNRPLPKKNVDILKDKFQDDWQNRFNSPSGITGIAQISDKFTLTTQQRFELESLYSKVYQEGNILKADLYIFLSTIILLILNDKEAYRSYENARNILLLCVKK